MLHKTAGQIFDACRISATRISVPKKNLQLLIKNIYYFLNLTIFADMRYASLRYNVHQKFSPVLVAIDECTTFRKRQVQTVVIYHDLLKHVDLLIRTVKLLCLQLKSPKITVCLKKPF
jgi:hypothetical protein